MSNRELFYFQERFFTYEFPSFGRKFKGSASRLFQVKITHFAGLICFNSLDGLAIRLLKALGLERRAV